MLESRVDGAPIAWAFFNPNKVHVNSSGTIAFSSILVGGTVNLGIGLFTWNESAGVTKIAVPGDVDPSTGATFGNIVINQFSPSPLNAAGQRPEASSSAALPKPWRRLL